MKNEHHRYCIKNSLNSYPNSFEFIVRLYINLSIRVKGNIFTIIKRVSIARFGRSTITIATG